MKYHNTLKDNLGALAQPSFDLMPSGDRGVFYNRIANALMVLSDVQEACFLPLASC
jgi:hypothetical protein